MSTTAIAPIDEVRGTLQKLGPQFKAALPAQIPVERFVRVVQTAVASNLDLLNCDRNSLYAAAMRCAQDGLLPDGREAALVKFGSNIRYMPMVGGIAKKARNSGEIKTMNSEVVYERDHYRHWSDEKGEHFEHEKARGDRGGVVLTYTYAITKEDGFYFEEVDEIQMEAIEKCSKSSDGPWKGPFRDEMRRKSAIKRLAKYRLPSSADLDDVLRADDDMYDLSRSSESEPINVTPAAAIDKGGTKRRPRALERVAQSQAVPTPAAQQPAQQPAPPAQQEQRPPVDMI